MFDGLFNIWNKLDCVCLVVWNVEVLALPLDKLCCGLLFWTFLDYTCLGIYLLMDFSMLSRWPCLWTPSLSQSWPPSAASRYPFTLFCRKAACKTERWKFAISFHMFLWLTITINYTKPGKNKCQQDMVGQNVLQISIKIIKQSNT